MFSLLMEVFFLFSLPIHVCFTSSPAHVNSFSLNLFIDKCLFTLMWSLRIFSFIYLCLSVCTLALSARQYMHDRILSTCHISIFVFHQAILCAPLVCSAILVAVSSFSMHSSSFALCSPLWSSCYTLDSHEYQDIYEWCVSNFSCHHVWISWLMGVWSANQSAC